MKRKSKKLLVIAIASMLFIGGAFGTSKIVSAAANPCNMVLLADNLGRCNLAPWTGCTGNMSTYKCGNHYLCSHRDTRCTNGHIDCTNPLSH